VVELTQKNIAVVGVSHRPEKFGYKIFKDMLEAGYNVKGVSVRGGEVLGQKICKNLKELDSVPDMVITVVPAQITEQVVEECRVLGIKELWMQPGSESHAAIEKAKQYGITVTSNACIMIQKGIW
jgi:predicted CoA-binding protein